MDGSRATSVDLLETMTGLIEFAIEFNFPANAVEITDLAGANRAWQIGQIEKVALVLDKYSTKPHRNVVGAQDDVGVDGLVEHKGVVVKQ